MNWRSRLGAFLLRFVRRPKQADRLQTAFEAFFSTSPAGMFLLDHSFRYLRVNEALAALYGVRVDDCLGRSIFGVHSELARQIVPLVRKVSDTRKTITHHEILVPALETLGIVRRFSLSCFPLTDTSGRVIGLGGSIWDTTAQKKADEFYNYAPCGYHSLDSDGTIVRINNTELRWLGYRREELVYRVKYRDLLTDESRKHFAEAFSRFLEEGTARNIRLEVVRKNGSILPIIVNATAVRDQSGNILKSNSIVTDNSFQKKLEEELWNALRARDEFLSIASHDLKSPLTSLVLQLQLIQKAARESPPVKEALAKGISDGRVIPNALVELIGQSHKQIARLTSLVNDLLDLTRFRAGKVTLNLSDMDLSRVVKEVVSGFSFEARSKGIQINVEGDTPVIGHWDPHRIDQIVSNLISNAIKYGRSNPVDVKVEYDEGKGLAYLKVKDRGIGIPPAMQERVFERFARASEDHEFKGLGLGLYITRQIVEAHGGTIRLDSVPGQGSVFTVELPLFAEKAQKPIAA